MGKRLDLPEQRYTHRPIEIQFLIGMPVPAKKKFYAGVDSKKAAEFHKDPNIPKYVAATQRRRYICSRPERIDAVCNQTVFELQRTSVVIIGEFLEELDHYKLMLRAEGIEALMVTGSQNHVQRSEALKTLAETKSVVLMSRNIAKNGGFRLGERCCVINASNLDLYYLLPMIYRYSQTRFYQVVDNDTALLNTLVNKFVKIKRDPSLLFSIDVYQFKAVAHMFKFPLKNATASIIYDGEKAW